jgi:hypothetical protein
MTAPSSVAVTTVASCRGSTSARSSPASTAALTVEPISRSELVIACCARSRSTGSRSSDSIAALRIGQPPGRTGSSMSVLNTSTMASSRSSSESALANASV